MKKPAGRALRIAFSLGLLLALALGLLAHGSRRGNTAQVELFEVRQQVLSRQVSAEGFLRPVHATPLSSPVRGLRKIAWTVPDGSRVEAGDPLVRFAAEDFEQDLADGQADRASAQARLDRERALVGSAERARDRAVALTRVELERTRELASKDPTLFSKHQIIESDIDEELSVLRSEHAGRAEKIERSLSRTRLDLLRVDQRRADLAVSRAQESLDSLELVAPHAGVIVFSDNGRGQPFQVGDSVWSGQTLATLPDLSRMEAVVYVLAADAGGLAAGQSGSVVVEAHPESAHAAVIEHIDSLAKPISPSNPTSYFAVTLRLEHTQPELMKPGARVRARLSADEREGLVVPRQAIFERDGRLVAHVQRGDHFEASPVELGAVTLGRALVTRGLAAGDRIALTDPDARPEPSARAAAGPERFAGNPGPGR